MLAETKGKNILQILQQTGLSKTPQRIAVLKILIDAVQPINISGIRQALKSQIKIDRVTIYRILSLFKKHMIIREITSSGSSNYFELATVGNPVHPHFICRNCAKLSCLEPLTFSQATQWISQKEAYSIEHIEINISGLCAACLNATKLQKKSGTS
ncbi:MAG TPA: Fur family transcriptional regulator [Smithellaceae bacterium]|nr:Fur family transcriptional regulator [Smithellaceae bacterium]